MDGPGLQFVRQGRQGRMLSLPAQQAGEAACARAVKRHEPVAGLLSQGGTERLQLRHGCGPQVRTAFQQVQDVPFVLLRGVSACGVQQIASGRQALEGRQQNAPLPLGVAPGDGGVEAAGVGNALGQQGLTAARGVRQNEVRNSPGSAPPTGPGADAGYIRR